jgi:hypothetical protein
MLLFTILKGHRSNFHYSGPQKANLVDPEFKIYKSASEHPVDTSRKLKDQSLHIFN